MTNVTHRSADDLAGRVAVISGAAGGIGQAIAARFAVAGANIAVADLSDADATRAMVEGEGREFFGAQCNITDPGAIADFAAEVRAKFGRVDIVVNNAATMGKIAFDDLTYDQWRHFITTNLDSQFLLTKAFLDDLKASPAGRVINMSSTSPWLNVPMFVPYITSKSAIMGFTSALATDLGQYGITVNALAPSLVRTPGADGMSGAEDDYAMISGIQVIKRTQTPDDVAGMALFLASDAGDFITGQIMVVDGGLTRR